MRQGQIRTDPKHISFKFMPRRPKKVEENIFCTMGEFFAKDRIAPKIKQLRYKYKKTLDLGTQSRAGR